jgi:3-oxoadipate CoA-transferase beta subunit
MTGRSREQMASRAAQDIPDGAVVNLGMGMPVLIPGFLPAGREVIFQSENGVVGAGPLAAEGEGDADLVDASSRQITLAPGATIIDSAASFAMIRGGHVDITVLGAFEVASNGDLANWNSRAPDKGPLVGGAMDLATGSRQTWVLMAHNTRDGSPRLLEQCSLPLTGLGCVTRIYTDIAVIDVTPEGFVARELAEGIDAATLQSRTGAPIL